MPIVQGYFDMKRLCFPLLMFALFLPAISNLDSSQRAEGAERLEEAIRRSCITCYVIEGAYPQSIDHLQESYGIQIDDRYAVHYTLIASNLMPDITVTERVP